MRLKESITREEMDALIGSRNKWRKIARGEEEDKGRENCPLCQLQMKKHSTSNASSPCIDCPIGFAVDKHSCQGTPYDKWLDLQSERPFGQPALAFTPELKEQAQKFADWIEDLIEAYCKSGRVERYVFKAGYINEPVPRIETIEEPEYFKRIALYEHLDGTGVLRFVGTFDSSYHLGYYIKGFKAEHRGEVTWTAIDLGVVK